MSATALLQVSPPRFDAALPARTRIRTHVPGSPGRAQVEDFIHCVYRDRYGADVRHFSPTLVSLHDAQGDILSAAGYRAASQEPLFLERYLNAPVQTRLAGLGYAAPRRAQIVEVGHLASNKAGSGKSLILQLSQILAAEGFQWVVSTLTEELRHLFLRLGITPLALGMADPDLLGDAACGWGSYYEHHPVVLAGQLDLALQALHRRGVLA